MAPGLLHESAVRTATPDLSGLPLRSGRMRNVDLEVRERECKSMGTHVWAVWEAGVLLFGFGPETQPPEHRVKLITQAPVTTRPGAGIALARVCVVAFRIEPAPPTPGPSRAAAAAGTALGLEGHAQPEPHQSRVLPVEEGEAVLGRGDGEPNAGPNPCTILINVP